MHKLIFALFIISSLTTLTYLYFQNLPNVDNSIACTEDAMQCPDGSYVGRTGTNCEFECPLAPEVPADIEAHIESKGDFITLQTPAPGSVISSPLTITGDARGYWFFEASFPIILTNWDGLIIAETFATADGDWMTEDFVPFAASVEFVSPYNPGDPDFMKNGTLIMQRDNPSGLPENDDALEIPVKFQ